MVDALAHRPPHIDYSLYEVLPMAITADFVVAAAVRRSPGPPRIRIANVQAEKFPARDFDIPAEGDLPIDADAHEWSNYFRAGLRGAAAMLADKRGGRVVMPGLDVMCDGTVPSGGGLSSSAAFVCASALAALAANGEDGVDKKELCELAIVAERAVGVNSGG